MPAESIDILAVLRAPLEQYPPSIYQLEILAEAGCRIVIVDTDHEHLGRWAFSSSSSTVTRIHGSQHTLLYRGESPSMLTKARRAAAFRRTVTQSIRRYQPKIILAYDARGFFMLGGCQRKRRRRIIVHYHDLPVYQKGDGFGAKLTCDYARKNSRYADLVIQPDQRRADYFARLAGLDQPPLVVMNCPRLLSQLPSNRLHDFVKSDAISGKSIVYFHGWIGPSRQIDTIIHSMSIWPEDAAFVLVGPIEESYHRSVLAIAAHLGVENRVCFIAPVEYPRLLEIAVGADVACALIGDDTNINWRFTAGAVNKRFEYMALGKPQVTDNGAGVAELFERSGCGVTVDPTSPEQIGRVIGMLLSDPERRKEMAVKARRAHLGELNYERQFAPAKETIWRWLHT